MNKNTEFHLGRLKPLIGATITGLASTTSNGEAFDDEFFGFDVTLPNGAQKTLLFLSDDEGNGPGSFEIHDL